MINKNTEIVIAAFVGEDKAQAALAEIDKTSASEIRSPHNQVMVLSLDTSGKLSVKKTKTQKLTGVGTGALVGVLIGTVLGLSLNGAFQGGVEARQAGKRKKYSQNFLFDYLIELMTPDSSIIVAEVESRCIGPVMSNLELHGATTVLHTGQTELALTLASARKISDFET